MKLSTALMIAVLFCMSFFYCSKHNTDVVQPNLANGRVVGSVHGVILNYSTKARFDSAQVQIAWVVNDQVKTGYSNKLGYYDIPDLPTGFYEITFIGPENFAVAKVNVEIPRLEDILSNIPSTSEDYRYSLTQNIDLYQENASLKGAAFLKVNDQNTKAGKNVTVVVDYSNVWNNSYGGSPNGASTYNITPAIFTAQTDSLGNFVFSNLPAAPSASVYTMPFNDGTNDFLLLPESVKSWDLIGNGTKNIGAIVLEVAGVDPIIINNNFNNINNFALTSNLTATFSKAMKTQTFTIRLMNQSENEEVSCDITWDNELTVTINPVVDLNANDEYRIYMEGLSKDNHEFSESYSFNTLRIGDPMLVANNFIDVLNFALSDSMTATFSKEMNTTSFVAELRTSDSIIECDIRWSTDHKTIIVNPIMDLDPDTYYTLHFNGQATDKSIFVKTYYFTSLRIGTPVLVANNFINAPNFALSDSMTATFSKEMNTTTFIAVLSPSNEAYTHIECNIRWSTDHKTIIINPILDLEPGTRYSLHLDGKATDKSNFSGTYNFTSFRIGSPLIVTDNFTGANAANFDPADSLTATFSKPMNTQSFNIRLINLRENNEVSCDITWSEEGLTVTVNPVNLLEINTSYRLYINGRSQDNQEFTGPYYDFNTLQIPSPEIVASNFIGASASNFALADSMTATFSKAMDTATFMASLNSYYESNIQCNIRWSTDHKTIIINPIVDLLPDTQYELDFYGKATDNSNFSGTYNFTTFRIAAPLIVADNFDDVRDFALSDTLTATFSKPMNTQTVDIQLNNQTDENKAVSCVITWSNPSTVFINPVNDLDVNSTYALTINGRSNDNQVFNGSYTFSTQQLPSPVIVANNFIEVRDFALADSLTATFSKEMDTATFTASLIDNNGSNILFTARWSTDNKTIIVNPNLDLETSMTYHLHLEGKATDKSSFSGTYNTYTIIGIQFVSTNLERAHNVYDQFPITSPIRITFTREVDLTKTKEVYENMIDDLNLGLFDMQNRLVEVTLTLTEDRKTLIITPKYNLEPYPGSGPGYHLRIDVYSIIPLDYYQFDQNFFTAPNILPPAQVQNFSLWDANFKADWTGRRFHFQWTKTANAEGYILFAKDNRRNSDLVLVDQIDNQDYNTIIDYDMNAVNVNLPSQFDYYMDDASITPFLFSTSVTFQVRAVNSAGEGPLSAELTLTDLTPPTISVGAQSSSANNGTASPRTITISFNSSTNEYLSKTYTVTSITNGGAAGTIPTSAVTVSAWENDVTGGTIQIVIPASTDASGDTVNMQFSDTSGNTVAVSIVLN